MRTTLPLPKRRFLYGGGGGGGKMGGSGGSSTVSPDTLRSLSSAKLIEALSEGEIEGLTNGLKGVYFDGTPLLDAEGNNNFSDWRFFLLTGTQDQNYIPDFPDVSTLVAVGQQLFNSTPWIRHIVGPDVDRLVINMRFPRLSRVDPSNGNVTGTNVELTFEVQNNGGGYAVVIDDVVRGKCSSPYIRTYTISLPPSGPWDIRIKRITKDDGDNTYLSNDTYVDSFSQVTDVKLRYPNTAIVGLEFDAEDFAQIPVRTYDIKGIKIQIPANYDPIARTYATSGPGTTNGAWDGTFVIAWSDNPAWCWYDLATNERYGLGGVIDASLIDKYALYTIAQYCDELVSDGSGGMEPRFSCNLYIQSFDAAMKMMDNMATIFRGITYYSVGLIVPVQDSPRSGVDGQFSPENIVDGRFAYSGSAQRTRFNLATVAYNDYNQLGVLNYIQAEDSDDILINGIKETKLTAFGCWSPGQAWRLAKWTILTNQLDNDTITFRTGQDGMHLRPGMVIQTQDPARSGRTLSGRIVATDVTGITADKDVVIEAGKTYQLYTFQSDGTVDVRNLTNSAGTTRALTVTPSYDTPPTVMTVYIISVSDLVPELWRVVSAVPTKNDVCEIIGIKYNASKFAAADSTDSLIIPPTSILPSTSSVLPAGQISVEEVDVVDQTGVRRDLHITWIASTDPFLRGYRVAYRVDDGNWIQLDGSATGDVVIQGALPGVYDVSVIALNTIGKLSVASLYTFELETGNPFEMPEVTGLELVGQGNSTTFHLNDAKFAWRLNTKSSVIDIGSEVNGMSGAFNDPFFASWEVSVWAGGKRVWIENVTAPQYTFTLEKNAEAYKAANGGANGQYRSFTFQVRYVDLFNNFSLPEAITIGNPVPPALTGIVLTPSYVSVDFQCDTPTFPDFAGIKIWRSMDPNFTNMAGNGTTNGIDDTTVPVYNGPDVKVTIPQTQGTIYYYRAAAYDTFDSLAADMNISGNYQASTGMIIPTDTPPSVSPGSQSFSTTTLASVTTTLGSPAITSAGLFTAAMQGQAIYGIGIPPNTYILTYTDASHVTLSQPATAGGTVPVLLGLSAILGTLFAPFLLVRFTTDGTPVQSTSMEWPSLAGAYIPLSVFSQTILQWRAEDANRIPTKSGMNIYTLVSTGSPGLGTTATPSLSYTGHLGGTVSVTLTDATAGATIIYRKNGGTAVTYSAPFTLHKNDSIEYWATSSGNSDSAHPTWINTADGGGGGGGGGHSPP